MSWCPNVRVKKNSAAVSSVDLEVVVQTQSISKKKSKALATNLLKLASITAQSGKKVNKSRGKAQKSHIVTWNLEHFRNRTGTFDLSPFPHNVYLLSTSSKYKDEGNIVWKDLHRWRGESFSSMFVLTRQTHLQKFPKGKWRVMWQWDSSFTFNEGNAFNANEALILDTLRQRVLEKSIEISKRKKR